MTNGNVPKRKWSIRPSLHGRVSRSSDNSQDTFEEVPLRTSRTSDMCSGLMKKVFRTKRKKILKGISVYFNPGEMIGIMGPSGKIFLWQCKTFLTCHLKIRLWQDYFSRYFNRTAQKWNFFRKSNLPACTDHKFLLPSIIIMSGSNFHQRGPT